MELRGKGKSNAGLFRRLVQQWIRLYGAGFDWFYDVTQSHALQVSSLWLRSRSRGLHQRESDQQGEPRGPLYLWSCHHRPDTTNVHLPNRCRH